MSVIWFLFRRKNNVVVNFLVVVNFSIFFFHREVNQVMTSQILRLTLSRVYTYLYIVYVLAYTLIYAFDTINSSVYILIYVLRNNTCFSRAVAIYLSFTLFKPNRVWCKTYKSGISFLSQITKHMFYLIFHKRIFALKFTTKVKRNSKVSKQYLFK